ncbi:transmembrane emp24 domain-containing protein 1-like isoform X2 [Paramormyrops kingsleyae]|nr:transmembrane emp24 domain-containing protein 1-like isoform X2 [Paramormyrops kingsleyae]
MECFYQTASKNGSMEVEYQVIAGAGMDVDFTIISPIGYQLTSEFRKSDGIHTVEPTEEGDYRICFDNSFSRFSEKMVFFEVILEGPGGDAGGEDDWADIAEPESLLEYKLEDIRDSIDSVHRRLERSRQMQMSLRMFEARDRNLLEDNLWRVSFWSCVNMLVLLGVAFTQVYTVRRLFDDKRRVRT